MISVAEADRLLAELIPARTSETVALHDAVGRLLFTSIAADRDGPPYHRVAMDGFAVNSAEGSRSWLVKGLQFAGRPPLHRSDKGTAVEVATGAVLPRGCDAVVPYEDTDRTGDEVTLKPNQGPPVEGRHVHHQGTDYRTGDILLPAGTSLRSPHLHSLATVGADPVTVARRPVWALAATGDELVEVRDEPQAWQIRRSNAAAIAGEASAWGLSPRGQVVLADDPAHIREGLERLLGGLDVLILTGGVSAGAHDFVPAVLADLGAETVFHKLAQRPGKPLWCGRLPARDGHPGTVVFGLPGNPVSSLFAFRRYVLPWLLAFEGRAPAERRVRLTTERESPPAGQTVFLPWSDTLGVLDWKGSGDFVALAHSTGFVEISDALSLSEPKYYPWGGTL